MTTAQVIADSISEEGVRLTTLQLRYPRFIHAEFLTHRLFSRNASSSRAIPVAKMLEQVRNDPAMPIHWGKNQPGMQAHSAFEGNDAITCENRWREAARVAADLAENMERFGLHKQVANRILEPFQFISVIVTATEWDNFFALRDHPDAQPEIRYLAQHMDAAMNSSRPMLLGYGDWHLPYVTYEEKALLDKELLIKASAARCARVSYLTHDGVTPDLDKDIALFDRLVGSVPLHASPIEHQATPDVRTMTGGWGSPGLHGNFKGWIQFRKQYELAITTIPA